ncbi:class I SAM-dependent methyltransferase [Crocosphaera sp. UHCC 0190]|uniref:class I SAM-dependent methyltransferase n=1 Tax=Crocosphaera sp. UHCC 0190 TaxID=3110246 RepID=UPI002B1F6F31|nr:class I SAM-dependent methyltransferase [Crocosphaera sp. UHCC 0190]MEA5512383.1 class I SAM-dependent methyltransferase [Crocosphaera sp. UHCC 0190]
MIVNFHQINQHFFRSALSLLMGSQKKWLSETIDWQQEIATFQTSDFSYPSYYTLANFHGIEGGYLNPIAALTYDIVTPLATPPNEQWIRHCLLNAIKIKPQKILDLGCGTGSNTIILKKRFPDALIVGLDLSPYMLIIAQDKAQQKKLAIHWQQGLAEATNFPSGSYDLVTISMVLHETPTKICQEILQESFRLLKPGGQLIILDANQKRLSKAQWLIKLFKEPYSSVYSQGNITTCLNQVGFQQILSKPIWWIYQVTDACKPVTSAQKQRKDE